MKPQSRPFSPVKEVANVGVVCGLAVALPLLLFPVFGLHPTLAQTLYIGLAATCPIVMDSHALRYQFERLRAR